MLLTFVSSTLNKNLKCGFVVGLLLEYRPKYDAWNSKHLWKNPTISKPNQNNDSKIKHNIKQSSIAISQFLPIVKYKIYKN